MTLALALPFCCAAAAGFECDVGFERDVDFDRERDAGFERCVDFEVVDFEVDAFARAVGFERAAGFDRGELFAERLEALFAFGAEPLDDPLVDLLRVFEAGLLFAILIPLLVREHASLNRATRSGLD